MNLDDQRYLNNPSTNIVRWSDFLKKIRETLYSKGYFEVSTSSLVTTGAFESTIDPLAVMGQKNSWQLHTSPEMEMKRLLSRANKNIFQITKCFRDDPDTKIHGTEFTMLEFYKIGASYADIIQETKELFQSVCPLPISFKETTIETLFLETTGISLQKFQERDTFSDILKKNNIIQIEKNDTWEDLFFKIMIEKIEPVLPSHDATIVKNYPTSTSVLSKIIPNTPYSERFEIYWQGMELCNGCSEVTDLNKLKNNFELENRKRVEANKKPHPIPELFFQDMKSLPECSGVAVGLDRLFMCIG